MLLATLRCDGDQELAAVCLAGGAVLLRDLNRAPGQSWPETLELLLELGTLAELNRWYRAGICGAGTVRRNRMGEDEVEQVVLWRGVQTMKDHARRTR